MKTLNFEITVTDSQNQDRIAKVEIGSLKNEILKADRSVNIEQKRKQLSDEEAGGGEFMSMLTLAINPAILGLVVKVIHDWFKYKTAVQKRPIKISFKTSKGEFTIETEKDLDVDQIVEKIRKLVDGNQ